jgi:hypothetical protein
MQEKSKLHRSGTQPIFSHIRDLSGIIDTIYGTTKTPEYPQHQIGRHASYYLHAHGYTASSIDEIASIWAHSEGAEAFVEVLGSKGMAAAEVHWLWDLIRHDDDCGF